MDLTMRFQPSTIIKSKILKGKEINTGGSMSMPIDIKTEAVTISMMRKGIKMIKPISKDFFNSPITKAGIKTQVEMSAGVRGRLDLDNATKRAKSFSRTCLNINCRIGSSAFLKASVV